MALELVRVRLGLVRTYRKSGAAVGGQGAGRAGARPERVSEHREGAGEAG